MRIIRDIWDRVGDGSAGFEAKAARLRRPCVSDLGKKDQRWTRNPAWRHTEISGAAPP